MKQAQQMQTKMAEMQRSSPHEVEGAAGGGLVRATISGKGQLKRLKIEPRSSTPRRTRCWKTGGRAVTTHAATMDAFTADEMSSSPAPATPPG